MNHEQENLISGQTRLQVSPVEKINLPFLYFCHRRFQVLKVKEKATSLLLDSSSDSDLELPSTAKRSKLDSEASVEERLQKLESEVLHERRDLRSHYHGGVLQASLYQEPRAEPL